MSATRANDASPDTLDAELNRLRLERRAGQLERVVERMRERARAHDACEVESAGLHRAAADFAEELKQIRQRLKDVPSPRRDRMPDLSAGTA